MPYKCLKCCKVFVHTAKKTETIRQLQKQAMTANIFTTELYVCPYCSSAEYEEHTKMPELQQALNQLQSEIKQAISHLQSAETEQPDDDVSKIFAYIEMCKQEKRALTDQEYVEAIDFNWKLTCQDPTCRHFKNGEPYSPEADDPCIECQTDFEEKTEEEEP